MAYQAVRLYFEHILKTAGASAVTVSNEDATLTKDRLHDGRISPLFKFGTSQANNWIDVDRGASPVGDDPDTLIVPAGHDMGGASVQILADSFTPPTTVRLTAPSFPSGLAISPINPALTQRYIRFNVVTSGIWSLPELIYTESRELARGIVPDFHDRDEPNFEEIITAQGEVFRTVRGVARRAISIGFEGMKAADQTILDDLLTATGAGVDAFYLRPPDTAKTEVRVRIQPPLQREQDSPSPVATGLEESVRIELVEVIE